MSSNAAIIEAQNAEIERLRAALAGICETLEAHPAYMGGGLSDEQLDAEGGDAAALTFMAYSAREALGPNVRAERP